MSPPPASGKGSMEVSRLIAEVHRRPELWDRQHPQHHNRSVLDHHWDSVAELLGITGKAARGKWKNLKDHFRKEYKRCVTGGNGDQEMSRWPYFYPMMFIREQISHAVADASAAFLSGFQYDGRGADATASDAGDGAAGVVGGAWYPAAGPPPDDCDDVDDDEDGYRPLNCLHVEYGGGGGGGNRWSDPQHHQQDENFSDDKHFLLSLLPMFSTLAPDKKLKARIAIETSLLNVAYPDLTVQESAAGGPAADGRQSPRRRRRSAERKPSGPAAKTANRNGNNHDHTPDTTTAPDDADSAAAAAAAAALKASSKRRKSGNDRLPAQKKPCAADARQRC